ncbi:helix-turn-helix transcriptional regulator [Kitasatospora cineracea]
MPSDLPQWVLSERRRVGARIRSARVSRSLSQERLALAAGLDRHTIYRTELGTHSASLDVLLVLAHALAVPVESFFCDRL